MNYEQYGPSTASAQYFLQLAGYLGIPVIAWNADNSGLERRASQSSLQLQLAPSLEHQTAAMLSILERLVEIYHFCGFWCLSFAQNMFTFWKYQRFK